MKSFKLKVSYLGKVSYHEVWSEGQLEAVSTLVVRLSGQGMNKADIKVYAT